MSGRVTQVICARWVVPVVASDPGRVLDDHAVAVDSGGRIVEVLPTVRAEEKYGTPDGDWTGQLSDGVEKALPPMFVHLPNQALIPGFVNAHTHTGMSLMRGKADDEPLLKWLHNTVWPIEGKFTHEPRFCYDGALLSAAEMLCSGTTTFADMYWNADEAAQAVHRAGIRALLGLIVIGFPSRYASNTDEYVERGMTALKKHAALPTVRFAWAPHAPYTVPDADLKRLGELSASMNVPLHIHLHETAEECSASAALDKNSSACHMSEHAARPLANLDRLGLVSERLLAAHMVHLDDDEIKLLAKRRASVTHCPSSNLKLASGFCRVADLVKAGVNVALGTDSAGSNNNLDMFEEMKLAALLAKGVSNDATAIPAPMALKMATLNGARALHLEDEIGSIEVGKLADLVAVELGTRPGTSPVFSPVSTLVYSAGREDVREVWVGGRRLVSAGHLMHLNEIEIMRRSEAWGQQIDEACPTHDSKR
mmetsp:Transcript_3619/g.7924  ORF Transcript_3619/g.7924 Transcript_3619/m.7924 type:complete len:482 (-) Transcript_3619:1496-2941(-)